MISIVTYFYVLDSELQTPTTLPVIISIFATFHIFTFALDHAWEPEHEGGTGQL